MKQRHFVIIVQKSNYPQMGALYLSHALARHGIATHVLGSDASAGDLDSLIEAFDPLAVGCSVMTSPEIVDFARHSIHVQKTYNRGRTRIPIIWGGMHSTIVWHQTVREPYIDVVVSGEAEQTLPEILLDLAERKELPKEKLVRVRTPARLDDFRPEWESVDLERYLFPESHSVHAQVDFTRKNIFYYLLTSRGCTFRCTFCWEVSRTEAMKREMGLVGDGSDLTWRSHSTGWVRQQLDYLEEKLGEGGKAMDGVGFWDDMIFGRGRKKDIDRARAILIMMRERNFGYLLEARANQLNAVSDRWNGGGARREAGLYHFLKETGCLQVFVGAESGNQETLNMIRKGTKLKDYLSLVKLSREVKLPLRFSMIVGFPRETEKSVNDTLDLVERLRDEPYVSVSGPKLFTPYPGTPQYDEAVRCGMKVPTNTLDWAHLTRYADYRSVYPWLRENHSRKTLERIDKFWDDIDESKKSRPQEKIMQIVRGH